MNGITMFICDLVAVSITVFALFVPRHHRKDLVVALLVVNLGVLAAVEALQRVAVPEALGLGLFGILSIIRLRSSELDQREVAYYFASLSLGVLGGLRVSPDALGPLLMVAIVAALWAGDHPSLLPRYRRQTMTIDHAFTNEAQLVAHLETLLGATVKSFEVAKVDLVHDTTVVDVRFELPRSAGLVGPPSPSSWSPLGSSNGRSKRRAKQPNP